MQSLKGVVLPGCYSTSLLGWLKGLGLMAITGARGVWHADRFYLEVDSMQDLLEAVLERYTPKPIASPWNKSSGFRKSGGVDQYINAGAKRWSTVSATFRKIQTRLASEDLTKASRDLKLSLYPILRRSIRDRSFQDWLAAVLLIREVRGQPKAELNTLLGKGGAISNVDLAKVYLNCCQMLWDLTSGEPSPNAKTFLEASIANQPLENSLVKKGILCHLSPIADFFGELSNKGGKDYPANQTSTQLANPVDLILAIEGLLNFAGSLSEMRDGEFQGWSIAVYPLLLEVNAGSAETSDRTQSFKNEMFKYEVWLPIWDQLMDIQEFRENVLSDLRVRAANQVSDTLDLFQLIANKSEGLKFERYSRFGFWKRKGDGDYAIHTGIVAPDRSDIGSELRRWRKFVTPHPKQSHRLYNLLMALEQVLTKLAQGVASIQELLILLGRVELALSEQAAAYHPPQPMLSEAWVQQAYLENASPEFRLASVLASTGLRRYLSRARYSNKKEVWFWSKAAHPVRSQSLMALAEDLLRQWNEDDYHPSDQFHINASAADIQLLIEGGLDEALIVELAVGLSLCKIPTCLFEYQPASIPVAYQLAAKLLWDREKTLNRAAIAGLQRGSTIPLQTQAKKQQITRLRLLHQPMHKPATPITGILPPNTSNGSRMTTALIFPIRVP